MFSIFLLCSFKHHKIHSWEIKVTIRTMRLIAWESTSKSILSLTCHHLTFVHSSVSVFCSMPNLFKTKYLNACACNRFLPCRNSTQRMTCKLCSSGRGFLQLSFKFIFMPFEFWADEGDCQKELDVHKV